ncbi:hypothetical protein M758_UG168300 [Ceratodon purpureus]|nr:hypothetical protein M758_UG168300 [Ceratodon purpureus]
MRACSLQTYWYLKFRRFDGYGTIGALCPSTGNLKNLLYLYLRRNQLTVKIPYTLGYLSNAFELSLGKNNLTGIIPVSSPNGFPVGLNNLTSLMILDLKKNNLSGEIPPSLGQLQRYPTRPFEEIVEKCPWCLGNCNCSACLRLPGPTLICRNDQLVGVCLGLFVAGRSSLGLFVAGSSGFGLFVARSLGFGLFVAGSSVQ